MFASVYLGVYWTHKPWLARSHPSPIHMWTTTHTTVSQKTSVVTGVTADSPAHTPSHHSDTISICASSHHGDTPPIGSQVDPIVTSHPKVYRASHLHIFDPEQLNSILLRVTQTLNTPVAPQGASLLALAGTEPMPDLTLGQGDQGSSGNPIPPTLQSSVLGVGSTNVQGTTNPRDTLVRQGLDRYNTDDSWYRYHPCNESGLQQQQQKEKDIQTAAKC